MNTPTRCKNCDRVILWDDWCYVHLDGWANCRTINGTGKRLGPELDREVHAEPVDNARALADEGEG